ncbi:aminotransferase class V-fold PLP-dependent enzyme [Alkalinema pantanalense CENA528]|uniref:aminotransferase class V-fold PLP-dependent enzyme n=1 Tax=Alkalinema pantanalense TaxID=1620705 RepID=UPI003D6E5853
MNRSPFRDAWTLDPDVVFLNHGSFGACPREVLAYQHNLRQELEQQPLRFLGREIEARLDAARSVLADFVGADSSDLAFVPNATTGVNAVLRSLHLKPGDELLTTNQEYNACRNALNYVAERSGATIVVVEIPFPVTSSDTIVQAVFSKLSDKTRLVLLDHVVSQTALILPIAEIIATLNTHGIESLIDGAHTPGMLPLNLRSLGATYYTGNCHKWLCAPKGAAFLYVQPDRQSAIHPTTISHGRNDPRTSRSRFHLEFDWMGTGDPTAYLSVPKAIAYLESLLPNGWMGLMEHNHNLAVIARKKMSEVLEITLPCPDEMLGSMATLPLSDGDPQALYQQLWQEFNIEVPIIPFPTTSQRLIRISAQIYNTLPEYEFLGKTLRSIL